MSTQQHPPGPPDSTLVIFAARESLATCHRTLLAAATAAQELSGRVGIDVLVNGNPCLAQALADHQPQGAGLQALARLRIWSLPVGDKGNAWDTYFHHLWSGETLAFFIDGYVRLRPDALVRLERALASCTQALGASGVPTGGRASQRLRHQMLKHGGFHGNLCCIRGPVIAQIRQRQIHIPMGMYRVDSLVGALLCFGLSPAEKSWQSRRIVVDGLASWEIDAKQWWRWSDLTAKFNQLLRQAKGRLENTAVRYFFTSKRIPPEQLAVDALTLVRAWAQANPQACKRLLLTDPLVALAWHRQGGKTIDLTHRHQAQLLLQRLQSDAP